MARHRRKPSPWLLGLVIAVVVFAAIFVVFSLLGYGDDPVIESAGSLFR